MDKTTVAFDAALIVEAVVILVVAIAAFFIRVWINSVVAELREVRAALPTKADKPTVEEIESRVHDIEKNMVRREDMQRLEDKLDMKMEKQDTKLDRVITLLLAHRRAEEGTP